MEIMQTLWWIPALLASLFLAVYMLVNQQYKLPALQLMMWRGFGVALVTLPFVLLLEPPEDWRFYAVASAQGMLVAYLDRTFLTAIARFGAGVTSRLLPLNIWLAFLIWLAFSPDQYADLKADPEIFAGVVVCLIGSALAMFFVRRNPVSREALLMLSAAIFCLAIIDNLNKTAMSLGPLVSVAVYYTFIVSFTAAFMNMIFTPASQLRQLWRDAMSPRTVQAGLIIVLFMTLGMLTKTISMAFTPNPAYAGAIIMASPIWITAYNRLRGIDDPANVKAELAFVGFTVGLILLTVG